MTRNKALRKLQRTIERPRLRRWREIAAQIEQLRAAIAAAPVMPAASVFTPPPGVTLTAIDPDPVPAVPLRPFRPRPKLLDLSAAPSAMEARAADWRGKPTG